MKHFLFFLLLQLATSTLSIAQDHQPAKPFVHIVFFKLKSGANKQLLLNSLETFKKISVIKNSQIGLHKDTGHPKSVLSDYSVMVQLTFGSISDFRVYEKHPVHLASIEATKALMASPPTSYDCYMTDK